VEVIKITIMHHTLDGWALAVHEECMTTKKSIYVCVNKRGGKVCIGPSQAKCFALCINARGVDLILDAVSKEKSSRS